MSKQQIPTLSTLDLDQSKILSLNSTDSDKEMKSAQVKSDIDELAELFKNKTKNGIATFKSALKVCLENNHNALLHEAAEHGNKDLVIEILKVNWGSIDSITPQGLSVLHSAIAGANNKEIIEILLQEKPTLVTQKDASGLTPLNYNTSKEILQILQDYERNVIEQILIKPPKYVPITHPKCFPIAEWIGWEEDMKYYLFITGQNTSINSEEL